MDDGFHFFFDLWPCLSSLAGLDILEIGGALKLGFEK